MKQNPTTTQNNGAIDDTSAINKLQVGCRVIGTGPYTGLVGTVRHTDPITGIIWVNKLAQAMPNKFLGCSHVYVPAIFLKLSDKTKS